MRNAESLTHSQITVFLKASETIEFAGQSRAEVCGWVQKTLVAQEYARQGKKGRGAIRAYLSTVTGLSLPQITRLIRSHMQTGTVAAKAYRRHRFATKYTRADVKLLAEVDRVNCREARNWSSVISSMWADLLVVPMRTTTHKDCATQVPKPKKGPAPCEPNTRHPARAEMHYNRSVGHLQLCCRH